MIRALLVDDHPAILWAVRRLLEQGSNVEVVGEARDGEEAIRELGRLKVDVVVLDIYMPKTDGFGVMRALARMPASPKVVVLSSNGSPGVKERIMAAGADAFVAKRNAFKELLPAIRAVISRGQDVATQAE
ncbi:MAG: response regulator [Chloroflexota bacterium]